MHMEETLSEPFVMLKRNPSCYLCITVYYDFYPIFAVFKFVCAFLGLNIDQYNFD